jgi:UDP-glucose 4-epimerase
VNILVTGGAGYIGSHAVLRLLQDGHRVVALDNLFNSSEESLIRIAKLIDIEPLLIKGDVRDFELIRKILVQYSIGAVLHFAGLKSVSESVAEPLQYYDVNVHGSLVLLNAMADSGVFNFVFSSSATVYGEPVQVPIDEGCPVSRPTNAYGRSKLMVEDVLLDLAASDPRWRIAILRYFNPVGAHESGFIGEDPKGVPNNLLPYISQVAAGKLPELLIFGNNYPTPDGTGVRDYIHVMDLVEGHLCALQALVSLSGAHIWNLGTGRGYSVLQIVQAFESASGRQVPYRIVPRRPGDVASCYSDPSKAELELGWKAKRGLSEMMRDAWRWQQQSPNGYKKRQGITT